MRYLFFFSGLTLLLNNCFSCDGLTLHQTIINQMSIDKNNALKTFENCSQDSEKDRLILSNIAKEKPGIAAEILMNMSEGKISPILQNMQSKKIAQILNHMEDKKIVEILNHMENKKIAQILNHMEDEKIVEILVKISDHNKFKQIFCKIENNKKNILLKDSLLKKLINTKDCVV